MDPIYLRADASAMIADNEAKAAVEGYLAGIAAQKVLLVPPDITRLPSMAGKLTAMAYAFLTARGAAVDVMPALGSHLPMTEAECLKMFEGVVPFEKVLPHRWREDVVDVGEVPAEFVAEASRSLVTESIRIQLNRCLFEGGYDLILALGQVVPHEVVGMSGFSKHLVVGLGGTDMINRSHMLGAACNMEKAMGRDHSPVREVFDFVQKAVLDRLPLHYVLTVVGKREGENALCGLMIGQDRAVFEAAVAAAQQENVTVLDKPARRVVCWLDPEEFRSTWLGNKAIYRTRMAIADDGDLIVLAPEVQMFGEDAGLDALIRKYGYRGTPYVMQSIADHEDLAQNLSVAAHLIHGSSEGRFRITYCAPKLGREAVESVGFRYGELSEWMALCDPAVMQEGWNTLPDGSEVYLIHQPALGLWSSTPLK